jgi:hypothetical protein
MMESGLHRGRYELGDEEECLDSGDVPLDEKYSRN